MNYEFLYFLSGEDDCMRIVSKVKMPELEIIKIYIDRGFTMTVEIFKVPGGYKSFANNSFHHHYDLLGSGFHKNKKESVKLSIKHLRELMAAYPG
jgi:hypothetical protein